MSDALFELAKRLGWPILADPLSNLRNGSGPQELVRCYEVLLRNKSFRDSHRPDWVIHLGGQPTSKELNSFCQNARKVLLEQAAGEWRDPMFSLSKMIYGEYEISLSIINEIMKNFIAPPDWQNSWRGADDMALKTIDIIMHGIDQPFEGKLLHRLSKILKPRAPLTVVVGNSMPVRVLDAFFLESSKNITLVANKGANGIDGVVSTALGISAIEGNVLLILGDISFYHDMNGLLATRLHGLNATIIIVNNRGGGIFSFLPQHNSLSKQQYQKFFGMSHDLDFSGARTIYGGEFQRVDNWEDFDRVFLASVESAGLKVIEFFALDREANLSMHRSTFDSILSRISMDAI